MSHTNGKPLGFVSVLLSRCGPPINGALGSTQTDREGAYRLRSFLPPVGLLDVRPDTLRVTCSVVVAFSTTSAASTTLHFAADTAGQAAQVLNLTVP